MFSYLYMKPFGTNEEFVGDQIQELVKIKFLRPIVNLQYHERTFVWISKDEWWHDSHNLNN